MKANIYFAGEPSVGIFSYSYDVEIPDLTEYDNETRKWLRDQLQALYTELEDHDCTVTFDDECFDCGKQGCNGECNVDDFQNVLEEED